MKTRLWLKTMVLCFLGLLTAPAQTNAPVAAPAALAAAPKVVFVLPIREEIQSPLLYLVRRGVKQAIDEKADLLILDMETNGGSGAVMEDIINILEQFKGDTVTYVHRHAFSAGALIAIATKHIYMAPQGVIGAAAPVMMAPGGGVQDLPKTMSAKAVSAMSALMRAQAEKNGYNKEVVQAMIDMDKELKIDGKLLNEEGHVLTLTDKEAAEEFGKPPKPLLSSGTVESLDALLAKLGYAQARRVDIKPTGVEKIASWINLISPILLLIGIVGIYIEFKTPGFGLPGIIGITAFAIYFFGGYIAGLSGLEWVALFILGLVLVALELFVFPGTVVLGAIGLIMTFVAIVMALVDVYPAVPSAPGSLPALPRLLNVQESLQNLGIAVLGAAIVAALLARFLPRTQLYHTLVSQSASGVVSVDEKSQEQTAQLGQLGVAISALRPGGKAQFGEKILDVITQGEMLPAGAKVRIIRFSAAEAVVEPAGEVPPAQA